MRDCDTFENPIYRYRYCYFRRDIVLVSRDIRCNGMESYDGGYQSEEGNSIKQNKASGERILTRLPDALFVLYSNTEEKRTQSPPACAFPQHVSIASLRGKIVSVASLLGKIL